MIIHNLQKQHLESWFHKTLKVCLLAELREAVRAAQNVRSGILIFSNLARPGVLILMKRATPESADDSVSYGGPVTELLQALVSRCRNAATPAASPFLVVPVTSVAGTCQWSNRLRVQLELEPQALPGPAASDSGCVLGRHTGSPYMR